MDDDDIEVWKDCPTLKGYQVSSHGRVRGTYTQKVIDPIPDKDGYLYITEFNSTYQIMTRYHIHKLVMRTFIGERPADCNLIRHLDDIKTNNRADNLFYGTFRENFQDAVRNRRIKRVGSDRASPRPKLTKGAVHNRQIKKPVRPRVKLTRDQILEIKQHVLTNGEMTYADRRQFAERFNVHPDTVKNVANGKSWGHIKPVIPEDGWQ